MYTYEDLCRDAERIPAQYPGAVTVDSLGITEDGRALYHFVVGDLRAQKSIFINGGMHGREYMTCELVMRQLERFLQNLRLGNFYQGESCRSFLENCAIHVVPMVNPDGVSISQSGCRGVRTGRMKRKLEQIAGEDAQKLSDDALSTWKANGNGVDLNRNFDALWESFEGAPYPSAEHYKGERPGSEQETKALIHLTEQQHFVRTISYHAQGSVIYWYFGQTGELYAKNRSFAGRISKVTGYETDADAQALDPAGYKDWAISKCGIPSLTIEIGTKTTPVPEQQFPDIWKRNIFVWEETLADIKRR